MILRPPAASWHAEKSHPHLSSLGLTRGSIPFQIPGSALCLPEDDSFYGLKGDAFSGITVTIYLLQVLLFSLFLSEKACAEAHVRGDTVYGLNVRVQSMPGVDPRQQALLEAQKKAFHLFVRQGAPDEKIAPPTDAELSNGVQDVSIPEEKITTKHYQATVNVTFKPHALDRWMQKEAPKAPPPLAQQETLSPLPLLTPPNSAPVAEKVVTVTLHSFPDWIHLQRVLEQLPGMSSVTILEISQKFGKLKIGWRGGEEVLAASLQAAGFFITKNLQNQTWHVEKRFETLPLRE